jgi:pyruvate-formate lyase
MSFEEFQNSARLYVIGALEPDELQDFESARKQYGAAAEDFINQCYTLHEAFALSLKPAKASTAIKDRLMSMVRERNERQSGSSPNV